MFIALRVVLGCDAMRYEIWSPRVGVVTGIFREFCLLKKLVSAVEKGRRMFREGQLSVEGNGIKSGCRHIACIGPFMRRIHLTWKSGESIDCYSLSSP